MPKQRARVRSGLKNKLIAMVIGVGTIPLVLAMAWSFFQGNASLTQVIGSSFKALAYETSTKIDLLIKDEFQKMRHWASHPTLIVNVKGNNRTTPEPANSLNDITAAPLTYKDILENGASRVLQNFLRDDLSAVESTKALFVTDASGNLVATINDYPDRDNRSRRTWQGVMMQGLPEAFGRLHYDPKLKTHLFEIAVPIRTRDRMRMGVLHRLYSSKRFFSPSIENILFGQTGHVMLINSNGVVLDCPILPTGHQLSEPDLVSRVTGPEASWAETQSDGHGSHRLSIIGYSPLSFSNKIISGTKGPRLYTFAWQSSEELFAPTQKLLGWMAAAGFVSVLLIAAMGSLAANRIVRPIRQLQKTAESIGRGESVQPLQIKTGDEIELLAEEINIMNALLRKTFTGLEQQVEEKSREVIYLREYTESILMSVPESILTFDASLRIEYANPAFEKITGLQRQSYIGKHLQEVPVKHHEEWTFLAMELKNYSTGQPPKLQHTPNEGYRAKDPLAPTASHTKEWQPTIKLGDLYFAYQFFDMKFKQKDGRRIGLIMKNITEEKKLLEQLTKADKLSGLGTLTAGIAHEMNNPLYSIMGYTEAIVDQATEPKIKTYAQKVLDRSRHMANVILNMSGYARTNEKDSDQTVNINERIDAALDIALLDSYSDDIALEKHYGNLPKLKARPEELQQVFLNIVRNAVQAMEGKGTLTIKTFRENGNITISIRDTGPGIPEEHLSRIFDPFFTTKEQGSGTGLGLNIVHRVVEKYGGRIDVKSQTGKGTTFVIRLPISLASTNAPQESAQGGQPA
ncbi:PAS domain-containing sensor histidine kinase [Nitrospina gracilis]|uniref:PAS domain-containing sensor histidine kinase n=1 Tax=Nitrospina gracilis TaxID=35801 RepID=UPI001F1F162F|nr:PAS domain-containing sensor histidine kinase [Nitrospina gracilis]MCF8720031.1 signal transduction histidine kinase/HAMP domain-containing protein [Nitrospina gracilis Nb-211]